jgi:hypothetical protein
VPSTIKRIKLSHKKTARQKCLFFPEARSRKRVYISSLATLTLQEFLKEQGITINEGEGYCDNFFLAEAFDIADLKAGNAHIDCRCIINQPYTQLWIPKKPYEFGYQFDFYVAISIDTQKDRAEILGYVTGEDVKSSLKSNPERLNYYVLDIDILKPPLELASDIIPVASAKKDKSSIKETDHDLVKELFTGFLDDTISFKERAFFESHISICEECREDLLYLHLFDQKIKNTKNRMVFIDESIPIEEAIYTEEEIKEQTQQESEELEEKLVEEYEEEELPEPEEVIKPEKQAKEEAPEARVEPFQEVTQTPSDLELPPEFQSPSREITISKSEEDTGLQEETEELTGLEEQFTFIQEEEVAEPASPFRKEAEEPDKTTYETGHEVDIQPEETYSEGLTEEPDWASSYTIPPEGLPDVPASEEIPFEDIQPESWPEEDLETPQIDDLPDADLWQEGEKAGTGFDEPFISSEEDVYGMPPSMEEFSSTPEELSHTEDFEEFQEFPEPAEISYEEPQIYESFEEHPETTFESFKTFEDTDSLTLESLEEEHFDVIESFPDEETIDIQPTIDTVIPDDETAYYQTSQPESTYQEPEEPEITFHDDFSYQSDFTEEPTPPPQETSDLTLEDLEKEFDSIASFEFEEIEKPSRPQESIESYDQSEEFTEPQQYPDQQTEYVDELFKQSAQEYQEYKQEGPIEYSEQGYIEYDSDSIPDTSGWESLETEQPQQLTTDQDSQLLGKMKEELLRQQYQEETPGQHQDYSETMPAYDQDYTSEPYGESDISISGGYQAMPGGDYEDYSQPQQPDLTYDQMSAIPSEGDMAELKSFVDSKKKEVKKGRRKKGFPLLTTAAVMILLTGGLALCGVGTGIIPFQDGQYNLVKKVDVDKIIAMIPGKAEEPPKELARANNESAPEILPPEESSSEMEAKSADTEIPAEDISAMLAGEETPEENLSSSSTTKETQPDALQEDKTNAKQEPAPEKILASASPAEPELPRVTPRPEPAKAKKPTSLPPAKPAAEQTNIRKKDTAKPVVTISPADEAAQEETEYKVLQTPETIAMERQTGVSFLPKKEQDEGFFDASFKGDSSSGRAASTGAARLERVQNPVVAGLEEKEERLKIALNPKIASTAVSSTAIKTAKISWDSADMQYIDAELMAYLTKGTQTAKTTLESDLKKNNFSGSLRPTVITLKINNSTNSISSNISSSSGYSKLDSIILKAVRAGFSAKSLPSPANTSGTVEIKLTIVL